MQKRAINPGTWQDQLDFSQAIELEGVRRTVLVSGQLSVDKDGNTLHAGDMVAQFHAALDNLEIVLGHAGGDPVLDFIVREFRQQAVVFP